MVEIIWLLRPPTSIIHPNDLATYTDWLSAPFVSYLRDTSFPVIIMQISNTYLKYILYIKIMYIHISFTYSSKYFNSRIPAALKSCSTFHPNLFSNQIWKNRHWFKKKKSVLPQNCYHYFPWSLYHLNWYPTTRSYSLLLRGAAFLPTLVTATAIQHLWEVKPVSSSVHTRDRANSTSSAVHTLPQYEE